MQGLEQNKILKALIFGIVSGSLVCLGLITLLSFLFAKSGFLPFQFLEILMLSAAALGAFAGGYISAMIVGKSGMAAGAICAFLMFFLIFFLGIIFARRGITMITLIRLFSMVLCGALGGIAAVNRANRIWKKKI